MNNSAEVTSLILTAYGNIGDMRYFYFILLFVMYITMLFSNTLLIAVICLERGLHEPMYLFLCSLSVNELYGATSLLPALLLYLLSDNNEISFAFCFIQIFCLYTYGVTELGNLAVMSYDRYISICYPLHYYEIITSCKVCFFISLVWLYSFCSVAVTISLSLRLKLCGNVIEKIYCDNYLLVKLACTSTTLNNVYGLVGTFFGVGITFIPILYSYAKILNICMTSSKETRLKALNTCFPHLASLINFSVGVLLVIIQSRFDMTHVPIVLRTVISVYFIMCPPLFNPFMYGLRMNKIRDAFKNIIYYKWQLYPLMRSAK
ncbi:olfactory receptor 142-like [Chanos chanos]|uniref:Olfactory receptor n=1 Tax=Chanos chanos TaxID=29144 RepID=A0A6J2VPS5_CHACN|nr:olfactory receptor 142-like [Chanos chanos]